MSLRVATTPWCTLIFAQQLTIATNVTARRVKLILDTHLVWKFRPAAVVIVVEACVVRIDIMTAFFICIFQFNPKDYNFFFHLLEEGFYSLYLLDGCS